MLPTARLQCEINKSFLFCIDNLRRQSENIHSSPYVVFFPIFDKQYLLRVSNVISYLSHIFHDRIDKRNCLYDVRHF